MMPIIYRPWSIVPLGSFRGDLEKTEWLKAVRRPAWNGRRIGVIMRAVDHFPRCNDPFGPGAGDPLLNRMAQLLRSRTRAGSMASRYGGEEFTLVLPQATLASTRVRAARLRSAVTQLQGPYASRVRDPITRSRDVARFPPHGASAQTLRQAASSALDAAKPGGQDGVAVAPAI